MVKVYLFDWGDTLMVDNPNIVGKMCDWEKVEAVKGAKETLAALSKHSQIYIATGAADSTEQEVQKAFERVGLSQFIAGYFCKANLGLSKGSPEFLQAILSKLKIPSAYVAIVGDNFNKDIKPALAIGIQAYWFTDKTIDTPAINIKVINKLTSLYREVGR